MSSLPGLTMEDFLMWQYDLIVDGNASANPSLALAEALGTATRRRQGLTGEQFAPLVALFEEYRPQIESLLHDFDEETQSWRDYGGTCFNFIPDEVHKAAVAMIDAALSS